MTVLAEGSIDARERATGPRPARATGGMGRGRDADGLAFRPALLIFGQ